MRRLLRRNNTSIFQSSLMLQLSSRAYTQGKINTYPHSCISLTSHTINRAAVLYFSFFHQLDLPTRAKDIAGMLGLIYRVCINSHNNNSYGIVHKEKDSQAGGKRYTHITDCCALQHSSRRRWLCICNCGRTCILLGMFCYPLLLH